MTLPKTPGPEFTRPRSLAMTGERLTTAASGELVTEHVHRYAIALRYCAGKEVLDIACGEGYGSALLADRAARVAGVDIDPAVVAHAARKYVRTNLAFCQGSCDAIPLADASVDVVVSFETIEHHDRHSEMIREIRRVLRPNGLLFVSTPDRVYHSQLPGHHNPFHVKELEREEFRGLLAGSFRHVMLMSQRITHGSLVVPETEGGAGLEVLRGSFDAVESFDMTPVYFVALASDAPLPPVGASFFDGEDVLGRRFDAIRKSTDFRLGHFLLRPLRWIMRLVCRG